MKQNKINSLTQREVIKIKTQRSEIKESKLIQREVIIKKNQQNKEKRQENKRTQRAK